ncbi:hypothetical protein TELCIR_21131, partial [Teladorsagia circumcincta]
IILAIFMGFYYYACVVGILQLRTLISVEKMALPDSYLQTFQSHFEASLANMQPITHIKYHELIPALKDWRRIAAKYSDFDVVPYTEHAPFIDQTLAIDSTVWGSMGAALLCTAIACFIFIPNLACIITACFSVLSITLGILGLLSLWGE